MDSNKPVGPRKGSSDEMLVLIDRQMAYYEECLCQFYQQDMQFLEDRFAHNIYINKLFSYPMISKDFISQVEINYFSTFRLFDLF